MARPKGINQKLKWRAHSIRIARYADRVQSVYNTLSNEVAKIVLRTDYDGTKPFSFSDYPATQKKFEEVRTQFVSEMRSVIYSGTSEEWKQSNLVQDLLADKVLKFYEIRSKGKKYRRYYQSNSDVLKAFQQRKEDGLNLSQRLWNQSASYKEEMEYCLSSAIEKGTSAVKLSKRLSKYLADFPSLKKDYKEKFGKAVSCHDCEYLSIRLARSEINMAYRMAEQERWKQFDFVLGYEVKLTQNGRHVPDICDDLAGKYPKYFVFKGWHPNCMCYIIPILKSEEEFWGDEDVPEIVEPPKNFTDWIENNEKRIDRATENGTLPYWYKDNGRYVNTTRWHNWRKLAEYDDGSREDYDRVLKWKESLGLDTDKFESLLLTKDVRVTQLDGELFRLVSKIENEKSRFSDEWDRVLSVVVSEETEEKYGRNFVNRLSKQLHSIPHVLQYDVQSSYQKLKGIEDSIKEYEAYLSGDLVKVVRPSFAKKSAGFGSISKPDVTNVRDQLNAFVGTSRKNHYGFMDYRDHFDYMVTTGKMNDNVRMQFIEAIERDEGAVWKCIDHLNEMARATDIRKIPRRWYRSFNRYMEDIRAYDIETNGYAGVYNQIEGAYNIYKLSTHPAAIKYGLLKVSEKTPWNLFDMFVEKGIDLKYLPNNQLFRYEGDFIPWYDGIRHNAAKNFSIYSDAHYSTLFKHVSINRAYFDQINGRCAGNMYEVRNIFYHEYGHALDWQRGWRTKKRFEVLFNKYAAKYDGFTIDELQQKYWEAIIKLGDKLNPNNPSWLVDSEMQEKGVSVSDVVQAIRKDHYKIDGGHGDNYYIKTKDGKPIIGKDGLPIQNSVNQLAEFIAHLNEAYWHDNEVWELFDEEFYKDARKIMRIAFRGSKEALNITK